MHAHMHMCMHVHPNSLNNTFNANINVNVKEYNLPRGGRSGEGGKDTRAKANEDLYLHRSLNQETKGGAQEVNL